MENKEIYNLIHNILKDYGLTGFFAILATVVIIIALNKPENIKTWASWIFTFFGNFIFLFRRRAIKFSIEGPTTKALKKIAKELPDLKIPDLDIRWVSEDNALTRLKEGKAIVKLRFSNDQSRNIIKATTVYVRDAFLNHSKPYIDDKFKKAIDFSVSKKILFNVSKNQRNILSQFIDENISLLSDIREECNSIEEIDDSGLFTRILIRELDYYGTKLTGRIPNQEQFDESLNFLAFINDIATREPDDFTPLAFDRSFFKVGILLVAKLDTYSKYGLEPYLRRIKLGLAKGIETFYLLARDAKVEILQQIANELLETGNFILINNPKEYTDYKGRAAICYCLRINKDSLLADSLRQIHNSIKEKEKLNAVITNVRIDSIQVDCYGIEGFVKKQNLSIIDIPDAKLYFKESSYIEAIPLEVQANGIVEFTLKNTSSDPNHLLNTQFQIGKPIFGKVKYIDDDFIKVDLHNDRIDGIAFRNNLTKSRFLFLHELFKIDDDIEFTVQSYDFERGRIVLLLKDLKDLWKNFKPIKNHEVNFKVYKKTTKSFVGEIQEGIEAVLPYNELAWFENDGLEIKKNIRLSDIKKCIIKDFDIKEKLIILTLRSENNNPYLKYIEKYSETIKKFVVKEVNDFGIIGLIDNKYEIFIPKYEQTWEGNKGFKYYQNKNYDVFVKGIDKFHIRLIGSFKPFLPHPLKNFSNKYSEGQTLKFLNLKESYEWGSVFIIKDNQKEYEALLFNGEISNDCFISNSKQIFRLTKSLPLSIKLIDFDKNRILLSLKELTAKNQERIENLNYDDSFECTILGYQNYSYIVLVHGVWVEARLETQRKYQIGDSLNLRPSKIDELELILTDD